MRELFNFCITERLENYIAATKLGSRWFNDKKNYNVVFDKTKLKLAMNYLIGNCYFMDRDLTFWQVFLCSFKNKSILNLNQVLKSNLYKTNKFSNALRFVDCAISGNGLFQKDF